MVVVVVVVEVFVVVVVVVVVLCQRHHDTITRYFEVQRGEIVLVCEPTHLQQLEKVRKTNRRK